MFYNKFKLLCDHKNISCGKAAAEIGLSNSIVTKWKKSGATPVGDTVIRIANYFKADTNFLLGNQPFTYWDEMPADKSGVIQALLKESTVSSEFLRAVYGPRKDDFSDIGDYEFMLLVSSEIGSATPLDDSWVITLDPIYCKDETKRETSVLGDLSDSRKRFIQEVRDMSDADFNAILAFYDYVKRNRDTDV